MGIAVPVPGRIMEQRARVACQMTLAPRQPTLARASWTERPHGHQAWCLAPWVAECGALMRWRGCMAAAGAWRISRALNLLTWPASKAWQPLRCMEAHPVRRKATGARWCRQLPRLPASWRSASCRDGRAHAAWTRAAMPLSLRPQPHCARPSACLGLSPASTTR